MSRTADGLSMIRKVAYAGGNYGKNLVWSSIDFFWLLFLTDFLDLPPGLAGLIFFLCLLWDGISDPLMGLISDRTRTRFGKYAPFLLLGAPFCALSFALLFRDPGYGQTGTFLYALGAGLLFRTAYTICDVPHNALLARISADGKERSFIAGARFLFSSLGGLTIAFADRYYLRPGVEDGDVSVFTVAAGFAGVGYVIAIYVSVWATRRVDAELATREPEGGKGPQWRLVRENDQLLILLLIAFVGVLTFPMFVKSLAYFSKYNLGLENWRSLAIGAITIGQAVSIPFWIWRAHYRDKRQVLIEAYGLAAIGFLGVSVLVRLSPDLALLLIGVSGAGMGGINTLIWAMIPDVVDYGHDKSGIRAEGVAFGLFTFALKAGAGMGAALFGLALSLVGYEANVEQNPSVLVVIEVALVAVPTLGVLVCALLTRGYGLGHSEHEAVVTRLAASRRPKTRAQ